MYRIYFPCSLSVSAPPKTREKKEYCTELNIWEAGEKHVKLCKDQEKYCLGHVCIEIFKSTNIHSYV